MFFLYDKYCCLALVSLHREKKIKGNKNSVTCSINSAENSSRSASFPDLPFKIKSMVRLIYWCPKINQNTENKIY